MAKIELHRSGGFMGRNMKAEGSISIGMKELERMLEGAQPDSNPMARDDFHDSVQLNGKTYAIDISKTRGELKKLLRRMEHDLEMQ